MVQAEVVTVLEAQQHPSPNSTCHTNHQSTSRSLQSSMNPGSSHSNPWTPVVIRHSSCPGGPFFLLCFIIHSGHVLTVLRHVSVLSAFPTSRSFFPFPFPFIAVGADLPLPLLPFPSSGSKGTVFRFLCLSFQRRTIFLFLCLSSVFLYLYLFPVGAHLTSSTFAPQCTNVHGRRSSSVHSPEVRNMSRLVVCSSHISHSVTTVHCPRVQSQVLLQGASRSV